MSSSHEVQGGDVFSFPRECLWILKSSQWILSPQYKTAGIRSEIEILFWTYIVTKTEYLWLSRIILAALGHSQSWITSCGACALSKIRAEP